MVVQVVDTGNLARGFFLLPYTLHPLLEVNGCCVCRQTPEKTAMLEFQLRKVDYAICDVTHCTSDTRAGRMSGALKGNIGEVQCEGSET